MDHGRLSQETSIRLTLLGFARVNKRCSTGNSEWSLYSCVLSYQVLDPQLGRLGKDATIAMEALGEVHAIFASV